MLLEDGLFSFLNTYPSLVSVVSNRIYAVVLPQPPTYPCIRYQRIATTSYPSFNGGPANLENTIIQVSVFSRNNDPNRPTANAYSDTIIIAEQLRLALHGFKGVMGTVSVGSVTLEAEHDLYFDGVDVFHRALDFRFLASLATF